MKKRNVAIIVFIVILFFQLILKIYVGTQKEDFFIDEIYSYGLMNYEKAFLFEKEDFLNNWHNKEYFNNYLEVNKNEIFNLLPVYKNQVEDVHPPLYYLLLRIAATFTINNFTKWTGLILNLIIFILASIVLYKMGNALFKNKTYSILLVMLYGFSKFSLINTLYIRMYSLLELFILLSTYWHIRRYNNEKLKKEDLIKLALLLIFGSLTHYYFYIFIIGLYIVNNIKYIREKNKEKFIKYNITFIISILISILIFPSTVLHVFIGYRGTDSIDKFVHLDIKGTYITIKEYLNIINKNMYYIKLNYLIIGIAVLGVLCFTKYITNNIKDKKKIEFKYNKIYNFIIIPIIIYILIISKTTPYIEFRYIMSICVQILILIFAILISELEYLLNNKKIIITTLIFIVLIYSVCGFDLKNVDYLYFGSKEQMDLIENNYFNIPCIYIYKFDNKVKNNGFCYDLNLLRRFDKVYITKELNYYNLNNILEKVDISNGIIIYDCELRN